MRIHLSADYFGYQLARSVEERLRAAGHDVTWHGATEFDPGDDYPTFTIAAAKAVIEDEDKGIVSRAIAVGATGAGESITANKVSGARAVAGVTAEIVRLARAHADANVLGVGAVVLSPSLANEIIDAFIDAEFLTDPDDVRRIMHTMEYETAGTIEGWNIE